MFTLARKIVFRLQVCRTEATKISIAVKLACEAGAGARVTCVMAQEIRDLCSALEELTKKK